MMNGKYEEAYMKIRYHKPVSIYTHPSITEYEFNRMKKVERLYIIACIAGFMAIMFSFPCVLISSAKESKIPQEVPIVKTVLKPKPIAESDGEINVKASEFELKVDVGSTTIDTR
jgi:hypothetical protein